MKQSKKTSFLCVIFSGISINAMILSIWFPWLLIVGVIFGALAINLLIDMFEREEKDDKKIEEYFLNEE